MNLIRLVALLLALVAAPAWAQQRSLDDFYSPKEFHRAVLGTGTVPLELLEHEIDAYIAAARK